MPGHDDFGALQSASLCVRGNLFGNLRIKNNSELVCGDDHTEALDVFRIQIDDVDEALEGVDIFFFILCEDYLERHSGLHYGLLLVQPGKEDSVRERYRRIGYCTIQQDVFADNQDCFTHSELGNKLRLAWNITLHADFNLTIV